MENVKSRPLKLHRLINVACSSLTVGGGNKQVAQRLNRPFLTFYE